MIVTTVVFAVDRDLGSSCCEECQRRSLFANKEVVSLLVETDCAIDIIVPKSRC